MKHGSKVVKLSAELQRLIIQHENLISDRKEKDQEIKIVWEQMVALSKE